MMLHFKIFILILSVSLMKAAFAASSTFVVITPENETEHPFLIQVKGVAGHKEHSRVRVVGANDASRHAWLVICKKYVYASRQNFRNYFWYGEQVKEIERVVELHPTQTTLPKSGDQVYDYVEVELSHDQMRRAYIYIDSAFEINDGGYFYSIDLAYYLEGSSGKKSIIQWENK